MKIRTRLAALAALLSPAVALAQAAPAPQGPSMVSQLIFFGGFIVIIYFLVWRPQSKRVKEHKALIGGLSKGDEIVTNGGIAGRVTKVGEDFLVVEIADNVQIKVQKMAVSAALPKGTLKDV